MLPECIWRRVQPLGTFKIGLPDGSVLKYHSFANDQMARSVVWTNLRDWERSTIDVFCDFAKRSHHFIDIGAYSGIYTTIACTVNKGLTASIFEPNPEMLENIQMNVDVNGLGDRTQVFNVALSDRRGVLSFALARDRTTSRLVEANSIVENIERTINVRVEKLDDLISDVHNLDLVKIDVEGNELPTLNGMRDTLKRHVPNIIIECLSRASFALVRRLLLEVGYRRFYYIGSQGLHDTSQAYRDEYGHSNYLCMQGNN